MRGNLRVMLKAPGQKMASSTWAWPQTRVRSTIKPDSIDPSNTLTDFKAFTSLRTEPSGIVAFFKTYSDKKNHVIYL